MFLCSSFVWLPRKQGNHPVHSSLLSPLYLPCLCCILPQINVLNFLSFSCYVLHQISNWITLTYSRQPDRLPNQMDGNFELWFVAHQESSSHKHNSCLSSFVIFGHKTWTFLLLFYFRVSTNMPYARDEVIQCSSLYHTVVRHCCEKLAYIKVVGMAGHMQYYTWLITAQYEIEWVLWFIDVKM